MHHLLGAAFAVALLLAPASPVCRIGTTVTWTGSPADLAAIEAQYQMEQAQADRTAHPHGPPKPSPWTGLVTCRG